MGTIHKASHSHRSRAKVDTASDQSKECAANWFRMNQISAPTSKRQPATHFQVWFRIAILRHRPPECGAPGKNGTYYDKASFLHMEENEAYGSRDDSFRELRKPVHVRTHAPRRGCS